MYCVVECVCVCVCAECVHGLFVVVPVVSCAEWEWEWEWELRVEESSIIRVDLFVCGCCCFVRSFAPSCHRERHTHIHNQQETILSPCVVCVCVCVCIVKLSAIQMPTLTHSNSTHPTVNNCNPNPKHMSNSKFLNTGKTGSIRELAYCPNVRPTRTPGRLVIQKYE